MNLDNKINWAILVTGWGRNAKDIIEAQTKGELGSNVISLVVFEEEPCGAAEKAREEGIETLQLVKKDFPNMDAYQNQLLLELKNRAIDYVFMLSYKYRIRENMLSAFPNKILNVHPSLFPSFLATKTAIQDALAYGVKITGITSHIIDDKLDEGIILCQTPIRVEDDDTFETLYPKFAKEGKGIIIETFRKIELLERKEQ